MSNFRRWQKSNNNREQIAERREWTIEMLKSANAKIKTEIYRWVQPLNRINQSRTCEKRKLDYTA